MTKEQIEAEVKNIRSQMEQALASYHQAAGALQFAEWLVANWAEPQPDEKVDDGNSSS